MAFTSIIFVAAWIAGWFLALAICMRIAIPFGYPDSLPTIVDHLIWMALSLTFGVIQLFLMRRILGIEPHRWLLWTFLGLIVGIMCQILWKDFVLESNWSGDLAALSLYRIVRYGLMFGIPTVFQYFSLPMHMSHRWLWLLAALPGAALPADTGAINLGVPLSVILQSLAILRIATKNMSIKLVGDKEHHGKEMVQGQALIKHGAPLASFCNRRATNPVPRPLPVAQCLRAPARLGKGS